MNVQLLSDLHFECYPDRGLKFVRSLDPTGVDVLVLAGDIIPVAHKYHQEERLKELCGKFPWVIYAPGNHEYYGSNAKEADEALWRLGTYSKNLFVMNSGHVTIDGQRFIGGTMWFPDPKSNDFKDCIGDFLYIREFEPWVYEKNESFHELMKAELCDTDVVISHHLPSEKSVKPQYAGSNLNRFFLDDTESGIVRRQPKFWLHGHTHESCDYFIGKTHVLCNPRAYPGERQDHFNSKLVFEV